LVEALGLGAAEEEEELVDLAELEGWESLLGQRST
jgi:hypothetical protein